MRRALTPPPAASSRLGRLFWTYDGPYYQRKAYELVGSRRLSKPALHGLDDVLPDLLGHGGYFVEAGANDGFTQSNTYFLERWHGWSGLLVEPVGRLASRCRGDRPRATVVECALVPPEASGSTVRMHDAFLMSFVQGARGGADADRQHGENAKEWMNLSEVAELEVVGRTLTEVLEDAGAPETIDFLSLDLEGMEIPALRGLDLDRFAPRHILVEVNPAGAADDLRRFLASRYDPGAWLTPGDLLFTLQ